MFCETQREKKAVMGLQRQARAGSWGGGGGQREIRRGTWREGKIKEQRWIGWNGRWEDSRTLSSTEKWEPQSTLR